MPYKDVSKRREHAKVYYALHPEKRTEYAARSRAYYAAHREERSAYNRSRHSEKKKWAIAHRDETNARKRAKHVPAVPRVSPCEQCGAEFATHTPNRRFCTIRCKKMASYSPAKRRQEYLATDRDRIRQAYRARWERNPSVSLAGERVPVSHLPTELRPIALLIRETRREIRKVRETA